MGFESIRRTSKKGERENEFRSTFKSSIPPRFQGELAVALVVVPALVQAGEIDLARAYVETLKLPPAAESARAKILAHIPESPEA